MSTDTTTALPVTRVGWLGVKPPWLSMNGTGPGVALVGDPSKAEVVHAAVAASELARLRRDVASGQALVLHLAAGTRLGTLAARRADAADLILLEAPADLHFLTKRRPALAEKARLLRQPIDLQWHAPETQLLETPRRGRDLRRFRRFHRLAPPVILYAGPYTPDGGLDLALDAVVRVRSDLPEARLAAIPLGEVDEQYLDMIERRALALGHHAIIEWAAPDDEVPFWFACANVVCAPSRADHSPAPAAYAAAAGRPFVGTDSEVVRGYVRNGETGHLIRLNDVDALTDALRALAGDADEARRLGDEARRWAEASLTPEAALAELADLWREALSRRHAQSAGRVARPIGFATN